MVGRTSLVLALALASGGCLTLGPNYERPTAPTAEAWRDPASAVVAPALGASWWLAFGDPQLDALVVLAHQGNQDLAVAAARVAEARALAGRARSERLPEIGVDAGASTGDQLASFGVGDGTLDSERSHLSATFDFELDLWGRLRRSNEAAEADLLATVAAARAVRLALEADVVRTWFERAAAQHELELLASTVASRREAVGLQQQRFDAGLIAGVDFDLAAAELAAAEATQPLAAANLARAENRLAVLLGQAPQALALPAAPAQLIAAPAVPVGLPSTLLERRPDLIAAEQQLAAATARIGVAKAEVLPRLSLTGSFGRETTELADFVSARGTVWNAGASLVGSILGFGRGKNRVAAAEARADQAVALWRSSILGAFAEVEDALVGRRLAVEREAALARRVASLERARTAQQSRYDGGEASFLEVLDAERALLGARSEVIGARRSALLATVDLAQALGGGWEPTPAAAEPSAEPTP